MDEDEVAQVETVGQRLRAAREAKGLSVEDIAASTRIPTRHLTALENSEWDRLPAATYSIGFAKNYAGAVDLPRDEIGDQLRSEMGGVRPQTMAYPEVYETADPARTMPKGLVFGALILIRHWLPERGKIVGAVAMIMLLWLGSLEIDRAFERSAVVMGAVSDPAFAKQVALSIFWSWMRVPAASVTTLPCSRIGSWKRVPRRSSRDVFASVQ